MPLRRARIALILLAGLAAACSSITEANIPDPSLDVDSAHARWTAAHLSDYTFELTVYTAMIPPQGPYAIEVRNAQFARVGARADMRFFSVVTVDSLFARITRARASGEPVSELQFNGDGVPLDVTIGSFANDGGVHYQVREFTRR